jgi:hypothetical protein
MRRYIICLGGNAKSEAMREREWGGTKKLAFLWAAYSILQILPLGFWFLKHSIHRIPLPLFSFDRFVCSLEIILQNLIRASGYQRHMTSYHHIRL